MRFRVQGCGKTMTEKEEKGCDSGNGARPKREEKVARELAIEWLKCSLSDSNNRGRQTTVGSKINPPHICVFDIALSTAQTSFYENAYAQTYDPRRISQKQVARLAVAANVKRK